VESSARTDCSREGRPFGVPSVEASTKANQVLTNAGTVQHQSSSLGSTQLENGGRRAEPEGSAPKLPVQLVHMLFDPVFNQICDLLVVELYRQRVSVAENSHVR